MAKSKAVNTDPFEPVDPLAATVIYAGPTLHRRVMLEGAIYRNGVPSNVQALIESVPEIGQMIVPAANYPAVRTQRNVQGTEWHRLYHVLENIRFNADRTLRTREQAGE